MVQGLAFLSKKSWHTKNLNNQEKVWIAEERKKSEELKTKELQKQIQQELEQQELDAIAGRKTRDRGIDWMYEHGPSSEAAKQDAEKKAEEYLLGKEFVPDGAPKGDLDVDNELEGVNKVVSSAAAVAISKEESGTGFAAEPSVKERNEAFRLRFEDPMFLVAQQAVDNERKLERKKQLLEKVTGAVAVDRSEVEKKRKKEKKKRREERKEKKKRNRSPSSSSSDPESDHRHHDRHENRSRSRKRSPSPRRDERYTSYSSGDHRNRKRSRKHHRERSSGGDRKRSASPDDYKTSDHSPRRRSRSRSYSPDLRRSERDHSRSYSPDDRHHHRHSTRGRDSDARDYRRSDRSPERSSDERYKGHFDSRRSGDRNEHNQAMDTRKPPPPSHHASHPNHSHGSDHKYGLQGATAASHQRPADIGPDQEMLKQKREEKLEQKRQKEAAAQRRRMTAEERAKALEEMESNARQYDQHRSTKRPLTGRDDEDGHGDADRRSATFLNDLQRRAYGMEGMSMQERLQQNRNTHQRSHDARFL